MLGKIAEEEEKNLVYEELRIGLAKIISEFDIVGGKFEYKQEEG